MPAVLGADPRDLIAVKRRIQSGEPSWVDRARRLERKAETLAGEPNLSVVDKPWAPAGGDKHDYVSLARYYWPDPSRPGGQPYVRHDGKSNPEIEKFDEPKLAKMAGRTATLALAYFLTDREAFAEPAAAQVRAWFLDPATRMSPNMRYAQFIPGRNDGRGAGILDAREFLEVTDAVALLRGSRAWTNGDEEGLRAWFTDFIRWMRVSEGGRSEAAARNNHGSWYDAQICRYSLFVGDLAAARERLEAIKSRRIAAQIEPSGAQPEELKRTTSFDYSVFNLEALFNLAKMASTQGINLWDYQTPDGRSLRRAVAYLLPAATGESRWDHEQIHEIKKINCGFLLRRAGNAFDDPDVRRAANALLDASAKLDNRVFLFPDRKAD